MFQDGSYTPLHESNSKVYLNIPLKTPTFHRAEDVVSLYTSLSYLPLLTVVVVISIFPSPCAGRSPPTEKTLLKVSVSFHSRNFISFNSLSKVLFTFPSRYFYTIGFEAIFPIGWNVPPIHTPLQRNANRNRKNFRESESVDRNIVFSFLLSQGVPPFTLFAFLNTWENSFIFVEFPFRSPLLKKSPLFPSPPLSDMLKLRGFSFTFKEHNQDFDSISRLWGNPSISLKVNRSKTSAVRIRIPPFLYHRHVMELKVIRYFLHRNSNRRMHCWR